MTMRASNLDALLQPIIQHYFDLGMSKVPTMRTRLFRQLTSDQAFEEGVGMGGMAQGAWDVWGASGKKGQLGLDQLYTETYTHREYPVELIIPHKLIINNKVGNTVTEMLMQAGRSAEVKMENDAANFFINSFSTLRADGKALCASDHPVSPHATGTTSSNLATTPLTEDNLTNSRITMSKVEDDKGNVIGAMANEILVPLELENTARKITQSAQEPGTGNNAINPEAGKWSVLPWLRLTDINNWWIMDSVLRDMSLKWYTREQLMIMLVRETTTEVVYELKLHYSYGCDDWRWIRGHNVT